MFRVSSVRLRICGKINDFIIAIEFYGLRSSVFRDVWMVRAISLRPRALEHQETHTVEKIHNDKHLTNRRKRRVARIAIPMLSLSLTRTRTLFQVARLTSSFRPRIEMRNIFFVFILAVDVIQMLGFHCERTIKEKKWKPSSNEIPAASQTHTHTRALVHRPLLLFPMRYVPMCFISLVRLLPLSHC